MNGMKPEVWFEVIQLEVLELLEQSLCSLRSGSAY